MTMMKVKFLQDRVTKEAKPQKFKKDQVVELTPESAQHWINRGVAEEVIADAPKEKEVKEVTAWKKTPS